MFPRLSLLLAETVPESADLAGWLRVIEARHAEEPPLARAAHAGAAARTVGEAFVAGYRGALRQLSGREAAALCVTEAEGNHPRALRTTAEPRGEGVHLRGTKRWATLADRAETLLVAAVEGEVDGRPKLGVYAVPAAQASLRAMPPTPFMPEVAHFEVELDLLLPASARLPGDGWAELVKPFRTVEDLFVLGALAGFALRRHEPAAWAAVLAGLASLAEADPDDPGTHLALDGVLASVHALAPGLAATDPDIARDLGVLRIAGSARAKRAARARERLGL